MNSRFVTLCLVLNLCLLIFGCQNTDATSVALPIPIVTASGENGPNETRWKAFDGKATSKWLTFSSAGWIEVNYGLPILIQGYAITSGNDSPERDPKNWTLMGSNDDTHWSKLDTRSSENFDYRLYRRIYKLQNMSLSYQYYKFDMSNGSGEMLQVSEIELLTKTSEQKPSQVKNNSGFTAVITCFDPSFDEINVTKMVDRFFAVYPSMVKRFNSAAPKLVTFVFEPELDQVAAYATGSVVVVSTKVFSNNPKNIDVVTHESMHVVQSYRDNSQIPGWLVEGIADYARFKFGSDSSDGSGWSLGDYSASQHYTDGYRVAARFLVWIENHFGSKVVDDLDASGRTNYAPNIWVELTDKTVDQLWTIYSQNPAI